MSSSVDRLLIFSLACWSLSLWTCGTEDSLSGREAPPPGCVGGDEDTECCDRYDFMGDSTTVVNACFESGYELDALQEADDLVPCGAFGETPGKIPGATPLHFAAGWSSNVDVVTALVERGFDVNAQDSAGATALHYAACRNTSPAIVRTLIDSGADENRRDTASANPVYYAVRGGNKLAVIITLIKGGSNPRLKDSEDVTAFELARNDQEMYVELESALTPWERVRIYVQAAEFWVIGVIFGFGGAVALAVREFRKWRKARDVGKGIRSEDGDAPDDGKFRDGEGRETPVGETKDTPAYE